MSVDLRAVARLHLVQGASEMSICREMRRAEQNAGTFRTPLRDLLTIVREVAEAPVPEAFTPAVDFAGDELWLSPPGEVVWVDYGHSDHIGDGWRRLYVKTGGAS